MPFCQLLFFAHRPRFERRLSGLEADRIAIYLISAYALFLRYERDSNPWPSAWQADILTNWTITSIFVDKLNHTIFQSKIYFTKFADLELIFIAPIDGLEPPTPWLTIKCSEPTELNGNLIYSTQELIWTTDPYIISVVLWPSELHAYKNN